MATLQAALPGTIALNHPVEYLPTNTSAPMPLKWGRGREGLVEASIVPNKWLNCSKQMEASNWLG